MEALKKTDGCEVIAVADYIATEPYGIDGGHPFYFYLPGSNIDSLPEGYRMWLLGSSYNKYETLPVFGIYNLNMELGFYGV